MEKHLEAVLTALADAIEAPQKGAARRDALAKARAEIESLFADSEPTDSEVPQ